MSELSKLINVETEFNAINDFLDWLDTQEIRLTKMDAETYNYELIYDSPQSLAYRFFDINPLKLEAERRKILDDFRKANLS